MAKILSMIEFETRVAEVYSMARHARLTSEEIQARYKRVVLEEVLSCTPSGRRRYSEFMHGYVSGLREAATRDLYRNHLEFLYLVDGVYYSTDREQTVFERVDKFYGTEDAKKLNDPETISGHYWKGTTKPYFWSKVVNDHPRKNSNGSGLD